MRIIYGIPGSSIGGGINVVLEHADRLSRRGHDVIVLNLIGELDFSWNPLFRFTCLTRFRSDHLDFIRAGEIDVVVATGWQTVYELLQLNFAAKSFIYFLQADEVEFNPLGSLDRSLAARTRDLRFDYITCANWLCRLAPDGFAYPIVNGVNRDIFFPDDPLIAKGARLRILIEGPIAQPRKRIGDAFLACQPFRDQIDLWCVSSGGELQAWFRPDLFLQRVPMVGMRKIYSACDVIIKLSSAEGMFGPPLEMMACGGTAITSDCSGHEEYMRHGVNGLVVPVGDVAAVQAALGLLIRDRLTLQQLKDGGASTVEGFGWEPVIDRLETLLLTLVRGRELTPMKIALNLRETILDNGSMRAYYAQSYGSLEPPRVGLKGEVAILVPQSEPAAVAIRLRGWASHDQMDISETSLFVEETSGFNAEYKLTVERPDVYPSTPEKCIRPGFDIVHMLSSPNETSGPIQIKCHVVCTDGTGDVVMKGDIITALSDAANTVGFIGKDNNKWDSSLSGVIETAELMYALPLSGNRSVSCFKAVRVSVFVNSAGPESYIFYQPTGVGEFMNTGVKVASLPNGKIQRLRLDVPVRDDGDWNYTLLCTRDVTIDCVKIEF